MSDPVSHTEANVRGKSSKKAATGQNKPNGYKTKPRSQQQTQTRKPEDDQGVEWRRNEKTEDQSEGEDDENTCIVCTNTIEIASLSPCNHRVCHRCAFRQRALYDKKQCLICRTECERLVFTEVLEIEDYYSVSQQAKIESDDKFAIDFTSGHAKDATLKLLKYICPVRSCKEEEFSSFKALNEHSKKEHDKSYCSLCHQFKKAFIPELKMYTARQLQIHESKGDEKGFKGHPLCKYCTRKRFYSDDELFVHMRERHEKCHICDQIDSRNPKYFKDYDALFSHFRNDHYVCNVQNCLDQKFVVFRDDLDLQAHMIQEHSELFGGSRTLMTHSFGGQLSTFHASRDDSEPTNNEPSKDTLAVKRMRLEERARHYLNYTQSEFNKFQAINVAYQAGDLDAPTVKQEYEELFKDVHADITVLMYELSEICPPGSKRQKDLLAITNVESNKQLMKEKFPSLPGSNDLNSSTIHGWNSDTASALSKNSRNFPSLSSASSASSSSSPYSLNYASPSPRSTPAPTGPRVTSFPALPGEPATRRIVPGSQLKVPSKGKKTVNYSTLSYSSTSSSTSSSSTSLHSGTSTSSQKPDYSNVVLPKYLDNVTKKNEKSKAQEPVQPIIDNPAFPSLPAAPIKKKIPRVNPVNVSMGRWGTPQAEDYSTTSSASSSTSSFPALGGMSDALPPLENKGGKKKKGKQILFHIGM